MSTACLPVSPESTRATSRDGPLNAARYRNYHPTLGRWIERDPAGYLDGPNLNAYVSGNPAALTDPTGLYGETAPMPGAPGYDADNDGHHGGGSTPPPGWVKPGPSPQAPPSASEPAPVPRKPFPQCVEDWWKDSVLNPEKWHLGELWAYIQGRLGLPLEEGLEHGKAYAKGIRDRILSGLDGIWTGILGRSGAFKKPKPGGTGKTGATDIPSWAKGNPRGRPYVGESGNDFARRMMDEKYGKGNWSKSGQQGREFSQIKKYGDRHFE